MPLSTGKMLKKRYRIERLIKQGGFGAVYLAQDTRTGTVCAVKENLDNAPEALSQFRTESNILIRLNHPGLPRVYDYMVNSSGQYLVMEYIEGEDLQQAIDRNGGRGLPLTQIMNWVSQVVEAVKYLHQQTPPIIHRDIKPENIRVSSNGQIKLVDFGIAKIYSAGFSTTLGARAIAPGYSPFEQYAGHGQTDIRSDVYALSATLYTLLTGALPTESVMRYSEQLPPPIQLNPTLLPAVQDVILRGMEMGPDQRYQSVDDMWRDFRRAATLMPPNATVVPDVQKRLGAQLRMRRALQSGDARRIAAAYYPEVREVYLTFSVDERDLLKNALDQYPWLVVA